MPTLATHTPTHIHTCNHQQLYHPNSNQAKRVPQPTQPPLRSQNRMPAASSSLRQRLGRWLGCAAAQYASVLRNSRLTWLALATYALSVRVS